MVFNNCFGSFALSLEAVNWLSSRGCVRAHKLLTEFKEREDIYYPTNEDMGLKRHDALLVLCVQELGSEKASGVDSSLRVEKIESNQYIINDDGGWETILEPHNMEWISIK